MRRRIFVDNFAPATTKETLEELFKVTGSVESVMIPPQVTIKKAITHAFVVMESENGATEAIRRLNNSSWNGFRLTVTHAGPVAAGAGFTGNAPRTETRVRKAR